MLSEVISDARRNLPTQVFILVRLKILKIKYFICAGRISILTARKEEQRSISSALLSYVLASNEAWRLITDYWCRRPSDYLGKIAMYLCHMKNSGSRPIKNSRQTRADYLGQPSWRTTTRKTVSLASFISSDITGLINNALCFSRSLYLQRKIYNGAKNIYRVIDWNIRVAHTLRKLYAKQMHLTS